MTIFYPNLLSIAILDFKREKESARLFESLAQNLHIDVDVVYCHDGRPEQYVLDAYDSGKIDTLITTKLPQGCGIQTRQLFQACMTPYILYCQVDQFLVQPITEAFLKYCIDMLEANPTIFYIDLAGNQGQGNPSERALLMKRKDYLNMPGIDDVIGGPGPLADKKWTEKHLQDHMKDNGLTFATMKPVFFADNGKESRRSYSCGGETLHYTDEKTLFILQPLKQKYDYPNLKLSDSEWAEVLEGRWPVEGKIPEADKPHSFKVW